MSKPVPQWAAFFTSAQYSQFVAIIESEMLRRDVVYTLLDGVVGVVLPGGRRSSFGLLNLAQLCNQTDPERWTEVVRTHFESMLLAQSKAFDFDTQPFSKVRDTIKVRLYPEQYGRSPDVQLISRPWARGVLEVLVFDMPFTIATVHPRHLAKWGFGETECFELGHFNICEQDEIAIEHLDLAHGTRLDTVTGASFLTATRACTITELFEPNELGAIVAVPHRHLVLHYAIEHPSLVEVLPLLAIAAKRHYLEGPGSISPSLYWLPSRENARPVRIATQVDGSDVTVRSPAIFRAEVLDRLLC